MVTISSVNAKTIFVLNILCNKSLLPDKLYFCIFMVPECSHLDIDVFLIRLFSDSSFIGKLWGILGQMSGEDSICQS